MAHTYLQNLVAKITNSIDRALEKNNISKQQRQSLYKALFFLMAGDPEVSAELAAFCKTQRHQKILHELTESVGRKVKLPQVLHANTTKNVSIRNAQSIWKVPTADLDLIENIAAIAGVDAHAEQHLLRR